MKSETIRNATEAHGWVGLVISVPLFIIFWAGAVTLFYPEVHRWSSMPHFPLENTEERVNISALVAEKLDQDDVDSSRNLFVRLPSEHSPYMEMHIPVLDDPSEIEAARESAQAAGTASSEPKPHRHSAEEDLAIDPYSGEVLFEDHPFFLADFLNRLHFSLKLPQGLYIVGLVTFFFFVIIITGVVIQLKNLVTHFFLYRHKRLRYQMNDMHNVVGVISAPYAVMYALTGLMFNLHIVFEIPVLFLKYEGDSQVMIEELGFDRFNEKPANISQEMPDLDALLARTEREYNASIQSLNIHNYGDQNAIVELSGTANEGFSKRVDLLYRVSSDSFPEDINKGDNLFMDGLTVMFSLHLANFAGVDLRWLYFLIAISICGMIVAGNVLWIVKRQKKHVEYPKTIAVMRALTLGGLYGCHACDRSCLPV